MKTILYNLLVAGVALITFSACQKDEDKLVLQPGGSGTLALTPSTTTPALSSTNATGNAVVFNWTPAQYGFSAPVVYSLQFGKAGSNFSDSINVSASNQTSLTMTVADLNQTMLKLGLPAGSAGQVNVRVKSEVTRPLGQPAYQQYSAPTTIIGTPFLVVIDYPSLWAPGDYQGWNPATAPKIASVLNNGVYEGYINFASASPFKFTSAANWDQTNYGTGGAGKLSTTGDNLSVPTAGYYLIKADVNTLTWSATKTTWSILGAATPGGWDADTPLTYDTATGAWKAIVDLKQDAFKFRANNAWDINYGDTKADGLLDAGGDNINVSAAGKYLITLNLSIGGNYTYTLTKQ